jgi:hypothetical protein
MLKKFVLSAMTVILMAATLFNVAALAEGEGTQSDPLVTLSYINNVFTKYVMNIFTQELDTRVAELEEDINEKVAAIEAAYGKTGEIAERSTYKVENLSDGQTIVCQRGTEIMLRLGKAYVIAPASPGLIDTSTASILENGKYLVANHMYMVTINDRAIKASGNTYVVIRGDYVIK